MSPTVRESGVMFPAVWCVPQLELKGDTPYLLARTSAADQVVVLELAVQLAPLARLTRGASKASICCSWISSLHIPDTVSSVWRTSLADSTLSWFRRTIALCPQFKR